MTQGTMKNRLQKSSKHLLMMLMLLSGGVLFSTEANSQNSNKPVATLSNSGILQLPTNVALAPAYQVSISSMGFATEKEAVEFFSNHKFADFTVRPNFTSNTAVVMLQLEKHPGWTVQQWNALLNSATAAQPLHN